MSSSDGWRRRDSHRMSAAQLHSSLSRQILRDWATAELAHQERAGRSWRGSVPWDLPYHEQAALLQEVQGDPKLWPPAFQDGIARPEQLAPGTLGAELTEEDWLFWLILSGRGFGKLLALDTPIPTPDGWTAMGALQVGDQVFDEAGRPCRVERIFDEWADTAYRLWFSDGTSVDACSEHQWVTWTHAERKRLLRVGTVTEFPDEWSAGKAVRTTEEIVETLYQGPRSDRNHCIPTCGPLHLPDQELPIDPYLFGVWLGDGDSRGGHLTLGEGKMEVVEQLAAAGRPPRPVAVPKGKAARWLVPGLTKDLRRAELLGNKHVPAAYLRGSAAQRLALLQGLMDTDGGASRSSVEFSTTRRELADAVTELARSLGQKPVSSEGRAMLYGRDVGPKWRVTWRPTMPVFRLPRKLLRVGPLGDQALRSRHRMIVGAQLLPAQPMRCITVDSPNGLYLAGTGMIPTHNTRSVVGFAQEMVRQGLWRRFGIIGATALDVRTILVEGVSGFLNTALPGEVPIYGKADQELTWPNGAVGYLRAAEKPDRFRGPGWDGAICDELCSWRRGEATWDIMQFALREGKRPQVVIATTPKPTRLLERVMKELPNVVITRHSSYRNVSNLAPTWVKAVLEPYEGTRLGRQEIHAEVLDDVPGALWTARLIEAGRVRTLEQMPRLVRSAVAIDPAVSVGEDSAETAIIAGGKGDDGQGYAFADHSGHLSPEGWATRALDLVDELGLDVIVAEKNNGGDLVKANIKATIRATGRNPDRYPIKLVTATRGKRRRAEPVAALFGSLDPEIEKEPRAHLVGVMPKLEDQMCHALAEEGDYPNDRVDGLVWLLWWLMLQDVDVPRAHMPVVGQASSPWSGGGGRSSWG